MKEEASINFYRVARCGYYKHGKRAPAFCGLSDTLGELFQWVKDGKKSLSETCPYEIEDGEEGYRTFCFDIVNSKGNGEYIITTWNETPSTEGNFASVNGTNKPGHASVSLTAVPKNHIPGYATYFWFIPKRNILATIRFHHAVNGHQNLCRYMKFFLAKWTSHVVTDDDDEDADHSIVGYRKNDKSEAEHLNPMFRSLVLRKPGQIEQLRKNREDIRTIYRKNLLSHKSNADVSFFSGLLVQLGLQDPPKPNHDIRVKYEFNHTPEEVELNHIIAEWEKEHNTKWDDVGFKLRGDSEIIWLSHTLAKRTIELDVTRSNAEIVDAESLLNAVQHSRAALLKELP